MKLPSQTIQLHYLGERTYLQGTTLLDGLLSRYPHIVAGSFRVPKFIFSDCVVVEDLPPERTDGLSANAVLQWSGENGNGLLAVCEHQPSSAPVRIPYDEAALIDRASLSNGAITLNGESPFSYCSTVVSLNKALLLKQVRDDGQWIFTRLDFLKTPDRWDELCVTLQSVIGAGRVTKSVVTADNETIGDLYFSRLEKPVGRGPVLANR